MISKFGDRDMRNTSDHCDQAQRRLPEEISGVWLKSGLVPGSQENTERTKENTERTKETPLE
jgi:hypothetical protein